MSHENLCPCQELTNEKQPLLMTICIDRANNPPGGDHQSGLAYAAMYELLCEDPRFLELLNRSLSERELHGNISTDLHILELATVHATNYIQTFILGKVNYAEGLIDVSMWKEIFKDIMDNQSSIYEEILITKDIQKTEPRRGISYPIFINKLFEGRNVKIIDMCCSANLIWKSLISDKKKHEFVDLTNGQLISEYWDNNHSLNVESVIGIDRNKPDKEWLLSCRHIGDVMNIQYNVEDLSPKDEDDRIFFEEADINNLDPQDYERVDMITISTALYQFPDSDRVTAIEKMRLLLKPDGIILIQDYCHVDEDGNLIFDTSKAPFTYRAIVTGGKYGKKFLEIFKYEDSTCGVISDGKHINEM